MWSAGLRGWTAREGTASVTGGVDLIGSSRALELRATRVSGEEKSNLGLRDAEVIRWGEE
jgi:hypothetical protein